MCALPNLIIYCSSKKAFQYGVGKLLEEKIHTSRYDQQGQIDSKSSHVPYVTLFAAINTMIAVTLFSKTLKNRNICTQGCRPTNNICIPEVLVLERNSIAQRNTVSHKLTNRRNSLYLACYHLSIDGTSPTWLKLSSRDIPLMFAKG